MIKELTSRGVGAIIVSDQMRRGAQALPEVGDYEEDKKMTYTLYLGNGFVDESKNTAQGARDVETCAAMISNACCIQFGDGQMEQVLEDLVCVSYIDTEVGVRRTVDALRNMDVAGSIRVCAEYEEGCPIDLYTV